MSGQLALSRVVLMGARRPTITSMCRQCLQLRYRDSLTVSFARCLSSAGNRFDTETCRYTWSPEKQDDASPVCSRNNLTVYCKLSNHLSPTHYQSSETRPLNFLAIPMTDSLLIALAVPTSPLQPRRGIHTSHTLLVEETKAKKTLRTMRNMMKDEEELKKRSGFMIPSSPPEQKPKTLKDKVVHEVKHYYHGFKLLFFDIKVAMKLCLHVAMGNTLTRRERKQLVRTVADLFRLVPFLVFIIVPFMEFLLPVALKLFPSMLPSTFKEEDKEREKTRKRLKMKLEMAKFLQDTLQDMAVQRKGGQDQTVNDFVAFMDKIRESGEIVSNEEILKYSKLFEDEITLDNMSYQQLRALCKMLDIPVFEVSETVLRFQLQLKLRNLEADDMLIRKEGVENLTVWELQEACRARGMRAFGVNEVRLKEQLSMWLDLHLNQQIPTSLLLLSRALYMQETPVDTAAQLKTAITTLLPSATEEAKVKIAEESGERVDNKAKLEVIRQEQAIIQAEKEEKRKEEEKRRAEEEARQQEQLRDAAEGVTDSLLSTQPNVEESKDVVRKDPDTSTEPVIYAKDLGDVESVLENVVEARAEMQTEKNELKSLKDSVEEYLTMMTELKDMKSLVAGDDKQLDVEESKAAKALGSKVAGMIKQVDILVASVDQKRKNLAAELQALEVNMKKKEESESQEDQKVQEGMRESISEHKRDLVSINDLLLSMRRIREIRDDATAEKVIEFLDNDSDGKIDLNEAIKVIDMLGGENLTLEKNQVKVIMELLHKEEKIKESEKLERLQKKSGELLEGREMVLGEGKIQVDSRPGAEARVKMPPTRLEEELKGMRGEVLQDQATELDQAQKELEDAQREEQRRSVEEALLPGAGKLGKSGAEKETSKEMKLKKK